MATKKKIKKQDPLFQIVSEYGGIEIFSEENYSRLNKALMALEPSLERSWLLIANMENIPQSLYAVKDSSQSTKQKVVEHCRDVLSLLTLNEEVCEKTVYRYMSVLDINANVKKNVEVEPVIGSFNYADHEYKTCQIGDKIWFAENFSCGNTYWCNRKRTKGADDFTNMLSLFSNALSASAYGKNIGKDTDNQKYGRLYTWKEACDCVPDGWRLPTIEDFQDMVAYIESLRYDAGSALKSKKQWHGEADPGLDLFGFCAYPTARDSETGESQAWFWTASETGDKEYPHYCVCLSANRNEVILRGKATDDYHASIRYVKDV